MRMDADSLIPPKATHSLQLSHLAAFFWELGQLLPTESILGQRGGVREISSTHASEDFDRLGAGLADYPRRRHECVTSARARHKRKRLRTGNRSERRTYR